MKTRLLLAGLITLLLFGCTSVPKSETKRPYLLIVSVDGFRWDYPELYNTPFLDSLETIGVKATSLQPSYPSKTFPNHYTMATGLYPDHHGIVNNSFYDPQEDRFYAIRNRKAVTDGTFYGGEPIWVTAEKQGVNAASYFWVGSEAAIKGIRPTKYKIYDGSHTYSSRIDSIATWFSEPYGIRPHLSLLYFDEPDGSGHRYGPESIETGNIVHQLDSLLKILGSKLNKLQIRDSINLIITSDHGMANISEEKSIILTDYIKEEWVKEAQGANPVYNLSANKGCKDSIINSLSAVKHISVWDTDNIPDSLHYGSHRRTLDVNVAADIYWSIHYKTPEGYSNGTHGFDPHHKDMHAIFYAKGPDFKSNTTIEGLQNVDLYNLMCKVLHLNPEKNDGNMKRIEPMLKR